MSPPGSPCRGCGAQLVWGITAKGSKVPMDLPEKRYIQGRSGRYIMVDTHTPHHATCPEVDMFRKEKKDDPLHGDDQTPR